MTLSVKEAIMTSENQERREISMEKCIGFNAYGLCGRVQNPDKELIADAAPCADCLSVVELATPVKGDASFKVWQRRMQHLGCELPFPTAYPEVVIHEGKRYHEIGDKFYPEEHFKRG